MIDVAVGRLLIASLHQGIADLLPTRLEFYESWLNTAGLREGRIGLAPLAAVLSFLRQEGEPYDQVSVRAGEYAAEWTDAALPPWHRALIRKAPPRLRMHLVMRVARSLIRDTYGGSQARVTWTSGCGAVDIEGSVFCGVRDRAEHPFCRFYEAAIRGLMERSGLEVDVSISACRATGGGQCVLRVAARPVELAG
jgi:hypothetical protein